jgi:exopolyphosphatase/guanosine-5'-triphosphate,3'-diphosphate pyrophosphatase
MTVAVIDLGSNSIKLLVAVRWPDGRITARHQHTLDTRISSGIATATPQLNAAAMARGLEAVKALLAEAAPYAPARIAIVATSAVRDATNGAEFREAIRVATGHEVRLLSGDEEAGLIGRGLTRDPTLAALRNFNVFDLGGGSLECLQFRDRKIGYRISLPLGCVRMTEKFSPDLNAPLTAVAANALATHVRNALTASKFPFALPPGGSAVGTGGTFATARSILASLDMNATDADPGFDQTDPILRVADLRGLDYLGSLPLADRRTVPGLPAARADIFPAALATVLAIADLGGYTEFRHSFYNLRWGVAADLLE